MQQIFWNQRIFEVKPLETMLNNRCKKVCLVAASCVAAGVAAAADPPRTLYVMLEDPQNYRYEDRLRNAPGGKNPGDRKTFPHTTGWDIMDYDVPTQADGSHTVQLPDPTIVTQMFDKFALMVPSIPQKNLIDGKWTFPDFEIGDKASKNSPLPDFIKKAAKIKPGFKNFDKYVGVYFNDNSGYAFLEDMFGSTPITNLNEVKPNQVIIMDAVPKYMCASQVNDWNIFSKNVFEILNIIIMFQKFCFHWTYQSSIFLFFSAATQEILWSNANSLYLLVK